MNFPIILLLINIFILAVSGVVAVYLPRIGARRLLAMMTLGVVLCLSSIAVVNFQLLESGSLIYFNGADAAFLICLFFCMFIIAYALPLRDDTKHLYPYLLWISLCLFLLLISDSFLTLPIVVFAAGLLTHKFVFKSKSLLAGHVISAISLVGVAGLLYQIGIFHFSSLSTLQFNVNNSYEHWLSVGLLSLVIFFHQFFFFLRSFFVHDHNRSFFAVILLASVSFGLIEANRLLFPLLVIHGHQFAHYVISFMVIGLLFVSVLTLIATHPRQLYIQLMAIQSTIVLLGFSQFDSMGAAGSAVQWVVSLLTGIGFGLCILLYESRIGTKSFKEGSIPFDKMPRVAFLYLFFGFCMIDFPGTLGFVGEDLLVHSILNDSTATGFAILLAMACASIAIYRSFTTIFLGRPLRSNEFKVDLLRREATALLLVAIALVSLCFYPKVFFNLPKRPSVKTSLNEAGTHYSN